MTAFEIRLIDCCWVELEGFARPELVLQTKLKPRLFAIHQFIYDEAGNPLPHNPDAPRILVVMHPQSRGRRSA